MSKNNELRSLWWNLPATYDEEEPEVEIRYWFTPGSLGKRHHSHPHDPEGPTAHETVLEGIYQDGVRCELPEAVEAELLDVAEDHEVTKAAEAAQGTVP